MIGMIGLFFACIALAAALATVLASKRTWLSLAKTEEVLAATDRSLAESFQWSQPARATERRASAAQHEALAVKYRRRAWPWKPKEPTSMSNMR